MKVLKYVSLKGNNKRIKVGLLENDGDLVFIQETRTLTDFKTRTIVRTNNIYSVETFAVLFDVFSSFMQNSEIKNKILHKELSKIKKFKGISNF
jgi:hypothetical protein